MLLFPQSFLIRKNITILNPLEISGCTLWLKADAYSDGTWTDNSGSGNNAVQTTTSLQPTLIATELNGHPVVRFDGTDDFLKFTEISDIRTVFWLIKEDSAATTNNRPILGHTTVYDFHRGDTNKNIWSSFTHQSIRDGETRVNSNLVNGTSTLVPTEFAIISVVTTGNVKADNFSNDRDLSGRVWDGDLAELVIYNRALTTEEIQEVENYLNNKYSIY